MQSKYNPKDFEQRIYDRWMEEGAFVADENSGKPAFSMALPPPNITGRLHIGHALNHTSQDILVRYKRMKGFETLWLPGTDHASIATEVLVVRMLKEKMGISKRDLTRDQFLEHAWDWREKYGREIIDQMKLLGDSCDWSKERFTMDEGCSDAVKASFIELYEKGYIYRGERMVTWCPSCRTTISDAEIDHDERDAHIYTIKYPYASGDGHLLVATTRPETMYGDVAVAVHPDDDRYKDLIGKELILPVNGNKIPVVTAEEIDIEFGTGALKITPAHSETDYEIGLRHNLPVVDSINEDGTMNHHAGRYEGKDRYECRRLVIAELTEGGYITETKDHKHVVGRCDRCKADVEPKVSDQWFVSMKELAKPAIKAYKDGQLKFHPENYGKLYINWLEKIRDWNISRQLWWGHEIPAYHCEACAHIMVAAEMPVKCDKCGASEIKKDPDVLDTWFSSALWPFSTLGWPEKGKLYEKFYPTDVNLTSYDIIPLWVVRMVFQGIEQTGELPFTDVVINGIVRDKFGKKMSKSSGNGVDPVEMIDKYGADALRFSLLNGNSSGADIRLHEEKIEYARNFANKIWNASRFVLQGLGDTKPSDLTMGNLDLADRWILTSLSETVKSVGELLDRYDFQFAAAKLYDFFWNEYCDWYIELSKGKIYSDDPKVKQDVQWVLVNVLKTLIKLLHPYMPFITEEIWGHLSGSSLVTEKWPEHADLPSFERADKENMEMVMDAVRGIRNIRAEMNIPNSKKSSCMVLQTAPNGAGAGAVAGAAAGEMGGAGEMATAGEMAAAGEMAGAGELDGARASVFTDNADYIIALANCTQVVLASEKPKNSAMINVRGIELYLPLDELIDYEKEQQRLEKESEKLIKEISRIEGKLANQGFVGKAPAHVVEEERRKLAEYQKMLQSTKKSLEELNSRK